MDFFRKKDKVHFVESFLIVQERDLFLRELCTEWSTSCAVIFSRLATYSFFHAGASGVRRTRHGTRTPPGEL